MKYQILKSALNLSAAGAWLEKDSSDDFFPDALGFRDIQQQLSAYLQQREHRLLQPDTLASVCDSVPKASGMIREAIWLHPTHRLLYLAILHHLLPKLDHHLPPEVYSYRRDTEEPSEYPFPDKMGRWRTFHNDFRQGCLDDTTGAVLITDIASYYDHINVDDLCDKLRSILGASLSEEDKEVIELLRTLLRLWTSNDCGIPQNYDASSFFASFFLLGVDREMLAKRYRYFRWVDDIRICAKSKKQALRALHDLQAALARNRMFLASDKTKIVLKGTPEFEALLNVEDDALLSQIEDAVLRGNRAEISEHLPLAKERLRFHSTRAGDERKFRAFANRLMLIGEYEEFHEAVNSFVCPFVLKTLEETPHKSDYWSRILQESPLVEWHIHAEKLLRTDPSVYNWQRFYLWKLYTSAESVPIETLDWARSTVNNPISDLEAYQAILCLGKHGDNQDREGLFVQYFNPQRSYPIQRAILIAMQEMEPGRRDKLYTRAVHQCPDHNQLVGFLKSQDNANYGIRKRQHRRLPAEPRAVETEVMRGIGKIKGEIVRYRLSRRDYDYD